MDVLSKKLQSDESLGLPSYCQAHPWFNGIEWDKLYQLKAAFIPEVNDELDTQNFEKFEEVKSSFHFHKYHCICYLISLLIPLLCQIFDKFKEVRLSFRILLYLLRDFSSHPSVISFQADNQMSTTTKPGPWRKVGKLSFCQ